ncbi:MAG: hypothetical protein ACAI25_14435 [Planctomycetota bacterium]
MLLRGVFGALLYAAVIGAIWLCAAEPPSARGAMLDLLALRKVGRWFGGVMPAQDCDPVASFFLFAILGAVGGLVSLVELVAAKGEPSRGRDLGAAAVTFALTLSAAHAVIASDVSPIVQAWIYVPQGVGTISPWLAHVFWPTRDFGSPMAFTAERAFGLFSIYSLASVPFAVAAFTALRRLDLRRASQLGALLSMAPVVLVLGFAPDIFDDSFFGTVDVFARHALVAALLGAAVPRVHALADRVESWRRRSAEPVGEEDAGAGEV